MLHSSMKSMVYATLIHLTTEGNKKLKGIKRKEPEYDCYKRQELENPFESKY